jgi:anti-anti-sigma factor
LSSLGKGTAALHHVVFNLFSRGPTKIILNLGEVTHLDGAGLGELVSCWKRAQPIGVEIKLLKLSHRLAEVMEMTKLLSLFDGSYSDEGEVITSFQERPEMEPKRIVASS